MKYLLVLSLLSPVSSMADWKSTVTDSFLFMAGIAAGFAIHEVGHELTAMAYGENLDWEGGKWRCRPPCQNHDKVAISGNLASVLVGEALLYMPKAKRQTPFVDGLQTFNSLNPVSYTVKDLSHPEGYGDYAYLKISNTTEIAIAIHAATIGYRQFSGRLWSVAPKKNGIQLRVNF